MKQKLGSRSSITETSQLLQPAYRMLFDATMKVLELLFYSKTFQLNVENWCRHTLSLASNRFLQEPEKPLTPDSPCLL